ncbi:MULTISPECIES: Hsp20/alpha crystallin family protein [Halomonas]|uniref:Molecular chaperone n=1 Tax=Halomonas halophila TaxID=29573 RepID=A0ABQ0U5Y0_9GAMM|nr:MULTISPECIES: Hsp20/alpha crystallin family protein [Halomonas]MDR5890855.1 Hsp20/alpha crystallin family protein [Halomonas salina]WJY06469.1 Hsp20/alpha crystallin family protein [Halomonas halophila]GEK73820.1 molecular chaperone [Halomonas halophila]
MADKTFQQAASSRTATGADEPEARVPESRPASPFRELDRLFDGLLARDWMHPLRWDRLEPRMPRVDILDKDAEVVVRAEVPGFAREDLDVSVTDRTVTIKGESRKESGTKEEGEYYRCEISRGSVLRTVELPCDIDADKAGASFRDGVLELTLPKVKEAHRRRLDISS